MLTERILRGCRNRGKERPPSHQKIWEGYMRRAIATQNYERLLRMNRASGLYQRPRSD